MKKQFKLGLFKATQTANANQFSTRISGTVLPFISDFRAPDFELVIDTESLKNITITPVITLNSSHAGTAAIAYLQAANEANNYVQLLACQAQKLHENTSDAVYAMKSAIETGNYEELEMLLLLTPVLTKIVKGNWQHRFENERSKDEAIVDAILFNKSFTPLLEAVSELTPLIGTNAFKQSPPEKLALYRIAKIIAMKTDIVNTMGKNVSEKRLISFNMIASGTHIESILNSKQIQSQIETEAQAMADRQESDRKLIKSEL
jgi:hypothetical protein